MGVITIDKGMAWGTVFGAFIANFIIGGLAKSFGIIVEHFSDVIEAQSQLFLLTGGLIYTFMQIFALVSYLLVERVGQRVVVAFGSILAVVSLMISAYADNIILWMLSLGVLGGMGLGCIYFNVISVTGSCFRKYVGIANGLSLAGVSIGQMLFPTIINTLIPIYGPRGGALIVSGIFLHILITAALMPSEIHDPDNPKPKKAIKKTNIDNGETNPEGDSLLKKRWLCCTSGQKEIDHLETEAYDYSIKETTEDFGDVKPKSTAPKTPRQRAETRLFVVLLVLYILGKLFGDIGDVGLSFVAPNFAYELKFTDRQLDLMLAISGACDLVSRLFIGWFSDRSFMIGHRGYLLTAVWIIEGLNGLFWAELSGQSWNYDEYEPFLRKPDSKTFGLFFFYYAIHGICSGAAMTLMVTVLTDFVGNERFLMSLSLMMVIVGLFYSPGNFIIGMVKDITESYAWSIRLCSFMMLCAAVLLFLELPSRTLCNPQKVKEEADQEFNLANEGLTPNVSLWNIGK